MRAAAVIVAVLAGGAAAQAGGVAEALFYGTGDTPVLAGPAGMDPILPAGPFACANCHGGDGMGTTEGARRVPSIVASPGVEAWAPAEILAAVTRREGRGGRTLDPLMPRYAMDAGVAEEVAAFLAALPARQTAGIDADEVRLALRPPPAARPLAQAFAVGFDGAVGGREVWGRRITLTDQPGASLVALAFPDGELPLVASLGPWDAAGDRPVCARFAAEVAALLRRVPDQPVRIVAGDALARRAAGPLSDAGNPVDAAAPTTLLLTRDPVPVAAGATVLGLAAQLAGAPAARLQGARVILSDGCGALPGVAGLTGAARAEKLGAIAGEAVLAALTQAGRNLTQARLIAALGQTLPEPDPVIFEVMP